MKKFLYVVYVRNGLKWLVHKSRVSKCIIHRWKVTKNLCFQQKWVLAFFGSIFFLFQCYTRFPLCVFFFQKRAVIVTLGTHFYASVLWRFGIFLVTCDLWPGEVTCRVWTHDRYVLQVAGWILIIPGKPLALKIINNLYTRQWFLHKVENTIDPLTVFIDRHAEQEYPTTL